MDASKYISPVSISVEKEELKDLIKESVTDIFEQNRDVFAHIIKEVIEDKLFMGALIAGESTDLASRDAIFGALKN